MDSIIEDSNNYHISLLKVILLIIGKDIDLNKHYKILELNNIFNDISNDKKININEYDGEEEEENYYNVDTIKPVKVSKNEYDGEEEEENYYNVDTIKPVKVSKNEYDGEEEEEN